jgi:hypothetical protein
MATTVLKALTDLGTRAVGALHSIQVKTVPYGGIVKTADVDQFTLVEITGYAEDGVAECTQLSNKANKGYLVATPEQRYMDEALAKFYNAIGERARLVVPEEGYTRFSTSAYTKNAGLATVARGNVGHFDVTTKKYIISAVGTPHADYATSFNQFVVVADETDTAGEFLVPTIRLQFTKA